MLFSFSASAQKGWWLSGDTLRYMSGSGDTLQINKITSSNPYQRKFQVIKSHPALTDSIGMEVSNDTLAISIYPDTWSNTYKILSLKYRSGVDNSLNNRYDFFGNGQPKFYMFGDSSFLGTPVTIAGFDADGKMIEVLPSSLGGGGADGNNYPTSVGYTQSTRTLTIVRNGLADITTTLPEATTSLAGLLAGADKSFLDSLRAGQIIDTSYYGLISGPSNHDSAFVYWIPYGESNVDSSYMFLIPKYNSGGSGITQLGNTGNLWLTRVNDSTYAVDSATLFDYGLRRNDSASAANPTGFITKKILADSTANLRAEITSLQNGYGVAREWIIACSDETTALTTGTAKVTFRVPHGCTVTGVRASVNTVSSSGVPTVDINENGTTILSTKLTIDASEKTSVTAATAAVISDNQLADDSEITIDIDTAGTGTKGLKVIIYYKRNAP